MNMILTKKDNLNNTRSSSNVNSVSITPIDGCSLPVKRDCCDFPVNNTCNNKRLSVDTNNGVCQIKKLSACLGVNTISQMIKQFLYEKKMSRKELADALGIVAGELDLLVLKTGPSELIFKINLPLVRLYCRTRWSKNGRRV